jgi:hypothetical protein
MSIPLPPVPTPRRPQDDEAFDGEDQDIRVLEFHHE